MSSLLKDVYSKEFYNAFADVAEEVLPGFSRNKFLKLIFDKSWTSKELKERMSHTSHVLTLFLSKDFEKSCSQIKSLISHFRKKGIYGKNIEFMFFPEYIEKNGINHFEASVKAFEFVTQFTSCEFAVRPFIAKYGDKMMREMYRWSLHSSHHVRRLASEGSRPRLPWAIALPQFKSNPTPILPILEKLKNDSSEYVRRSVANNLNDISKDHPDLVISIAKSWMGNNPETDAVIKHACRTLLKQGHPKILKLYGLSDSTDVSVDRFVVHTKKVKTGNHLEFSFNINNSGKKLQMVRIEYGIFYLLKNGKHYKKVFKISERKLEPGEQLKISRRHSFRPITTRTFYPGAHKVSIIINGIEKITGKFTLVG
jgi:3-methyladenine DNA glycosylase AlkC